jgi:hypothetical protein
MTSTLCQARRPRLPLAAGRERHGHRSGVVGDAQRGWWMNGGGGCDVYWLLTWVGNSNHPCQNVKTNRIQWFGTKDGETFFFEMSNSMVQAKHPFQLEDPTLLGF